MNRYSLIKTVCLIAIMLLLGGCTSTLSSAERHAKHFVYASSDDFDPNFRTRMQEGVRLAVPLFNEIYQVGKKDKGEGMSREQAQKRANYLYSDEFLDGFKLQEIFAGKSYNKLQTQKWRLLMSQEAAGAYMDGYDGVK